MIIHIRQLFPHAAHYHIVRSWREAGYVSSTNVQLTSTTLMATGPAPTKLTKLQPSSYQAPTRLTKLLPKLLPGPIPNTNTLDPAIWP